MSFQKHSPAARLFWQRAREEFQKLSRLPISEFLQNEMWIRSRRDWNGLSPRRGIERKLHGTRDCAVGMQLPRRSKLFSNRKCGNSESESRESVGRGR